MKKRADGRYSAQIFLGVEDGKKKYKTVYGATQKEVKAKIVDAKVQLGKGVDIAAAERSFAYWTAYFLKSKEAEGIGNSHLVSLKSFNKHLIAIHTTPLAKVSAVDVQNIIDALAKTHNGKKPLSKRTLTGVKQLVGQTFKKAIGLRIVDYNPADYVTIPKNASETHRTAINDEQQRWIRDTPHSAQCAAMIMLYAGLRRGEATALMWADINLDDAAITVSKSADLSEGEPILKSPKTQAGIRVVSIPQLLVTYLAKEQKQNPRKHVLYSAQGNLLTKSAWRRMWQSYMQELNIKYGHNGNASKYNPSGTEMLIETFTPHQLRHTFASMLYMAGVDVLNAKEMLGHTDVSTTLGIYTHLSKQYKKVGVSKLDKYLGQSNASQ